MDLRDEVGQARMLSDDLQRALESRVVIEQAKAFVAAERAIGVEEAFDVLRDHARSHNTRLHDLAVDVVRRHGLRGLA
jgi:AmiR/NasT family two-component response regulator